MNTGLEVLNTVLMPDLRSNETDLMAGVCPVLAIPAGVTVETAEHQLELSSTTA